jgi:hypothetical protein
MSREVVVQLASLGRKYEVPDLTERCVKLTQGLMNDDNALSVLQWAISKGMENLKTVAMEYISK